MAAAAGYIRISKRNGRSGPTYFSPKRQREVIERIAREKGYELTEIVEEHDVSGGKKVRERELGRLVGQVEEGELDALIVWNVKRFSRNLLDAVETVVRITDKKGRLLADDFDSRQPMAKALIGLLAGLAEEELDARRADFAEARRNAVERGVSVAQAPYGYRRGPDGRLVVHEREARKVRDAFERRARGESVNSISRRYGWAHTNRMFATETYIGTIRSGEFVNEHAHEAIVSRELFDQVNGARTIRAVPTGDGTRERLLVGLAVCASCGKTLKVTKRPGRNGKQQADVYYCRDSAKGRCEARAFVHCDALDEHVADWFERELATSRKLIDVREASRALEEAVAERDEAVAERDAYVTVASALDAQLFQKGLDARQQRADEAERRVREATAHTARLPKGGGLLDLWRSCDAEERRLVLGEWLDRVEVSRGASAGLGGHVQIVWNTGVVADDEDGVRVAAA